MGLGFRWADDVAWDECPSWSYSGFHRFREKLAAAAGMGALDDYADFGGDRAWPTVAEEPLVPLLHHSDCEGSLVPEECAAVAPRLRAVISGWSLDDYDRHSGDKLAAAMEDCAARSLDLIFC